MIVRCSRVSTAVPVSMTLGFITARVLLAGQEKTAMKVILHSSEIDIDLTDFSSLIANICPFVLFKGFLIYFILVCKIQSKDKDQSTCAIQ
jgi:hypothetical protein